MKKLLVAFGIFFLSLFSACKMDVTTQTKESKIKIEKICAFIPDRYNTGCDESKL
jgi:hypothetical protein